MSASDQCSLDPSPAFSIQNRIGARQLAGGSSEAIALAYAYAHGGCGGVAKVSYHGHQMHAHRYLGL